MPRLVLSSRRRPGAHESLLALARDRPALFAEFYEETYEQVLTFFARRTLDPDTAFDLTAEVYAAAFVGLAGFRGSTQQEGYAWFWGIARNRLARWYERGRVEREALRKLGLTPQPLSDLEFERAEELADLAAHRDAIADALDSLPQEQQAAIRMRVLDESEYSAIAAATGVTEQVARARVSRGLRRLARILEFEAVDRAPR